MPHQLTISIQNSTEGGGWTIVDVRFGSWPCKNAKALNRDRRNTSVAGDGHHPAMTCACEGVIRCDVACARASSAVDLSCGPAMLKPAVAARWAHRLIYIKAVSGRPPQLTFGAEVHYVTDDTWREPARLGTVAPAMGGL